MIPPVHQRAQWAQPQHLTILTDTPPPLAYYADSLPHLQHVVKSTTSTWQPQHTIPQQQQVSYRIGTS